MTQPKLTKRDLAWGWVVLLLPFALLVILLVVSVDMRHMSIVFSRLAVKPATGKSCKSEPAVKPWVIYEDGYRATTNRDAVRDWMTERAFCGFSWGGNDDVLTVCLQATESATPRHELLRLAEEARSNLPPGCPITIEVETLEEALASEERFMESCRADMEALKRIHGDEEPTK